MSFFEGFALDLDKEMKTTKVEHSSVSFSIFIYTLQYNTGGLFLQ